MKRLMIIGAVLVAAMLGGCATTIRSDVTTFHQWPAQLQDKSYGFEAPPPQDDTLELRSYQNLVRAELAKLGFQEAAHGQKPALTVSMRFTTTDLPLRQLRPSYYGPAFSSFYYSPRVVWVPTRRGYVPRYVYGGYGAFGRPGWGNPFYDPWFDDPFGGYQEVVRHHYKRELQVSIKSAAGQRLFDVTVHNTSRDPSTPAIMPALVQSAFEGFPGPNGVSRQIELKREG